MRYIFLSLSLHYRNKILTMTKQALLEEPLASVENGNNNDEKQSIW
jgi:hypothetical protein